MSSTNHAVTDETIRLTSRRDPTRFVPPSCDLAQARDSGRWRSIKILEPGVHTEPHDATAVMAYRDVREVLSHPAVINGQAVFNVEGSRASQPGNLVYKDGEEHRRLRMVLIRHFTFKRVAAMRPRIEAIVDGLLDDVEAAGSPVDLVPIYTRPLPALVFCELMGIPYGDHTDVLRWTDTLLSLSSTPEQNHAAVADITAWMTDHVRHVMKNPGEDLMSALVAGAGENLTEEEAIGMGAIIMGAGIDTTSHSTALGILSLLQKPDQRRILEADGELTSNAVDEMVRYVSPVPAAQLRHASQEVTIGQNSVPGGTSVMVSLLAANYDPELVGEKADLDLRRGRTSHVAFGYGAHQCPGQHLARLEMTLGISRAFQRFPNLTLNGDPEDFGWLRHNLIYGIGSLPVTY